MLMRLKGLTFLYFAHFCAMAISFHNFVQIIMAKHLHHFLTISVGSACLLACLLKCIKHCVCSCSHAGSLKAWSDVNFMTGV